jgi:succinate dehydrogenase / fumarate reductase membrane anchor subunit
VVTNVTSLTRSGLADFVVQRVSAVIIALYTLCVLGFFIVTPGVAYGQLVSYLGSTPMQLFSTLAVLSTAAHAWIGMWTIGTDYIQEHYFGAHATTFRLLYQAGVIGVLFLYVAWALQLFWGLNPSAA